MLNYEKLMKLGPTCYETRVNQLGQTLHFLEHPTLGDEAEVIVAIHELKVADYSGAMDMGDFYEGSEYMPCYQHGKFYSAFELDL